MTQDELWLKKYQEVKDVIETNHRNPYRYNPEERFKDCKWIKHNKKLLNAGEMKEGGEALFENLIVKDGPYEPIGPEDILEL